ncbi:hypothetical protein [Kitasatospora sp. CB02891]|uniref:hypothetical protein n=1 Tax=Kitasatospora sp. CB02891 TaxID=2020329 RepID=UPI000C270217|nr:hypothetical protein [Kitasatospora sp. CB02891]PJN22418.1 hypothetical protein CG736_28305 [Kitasatospora sp. CB02891]
MPIVDLASVKLHLNIPTTDTRQDLELQRFMAAADDHVRDVCGPITAELHTEWHDGGRSTIALDWLPLASVQTVVEYVAASSWILTEQPLGSSTDSYGYTVDAERGSITRRAVGVAVPFPAGTRNVRVVYTSGTGGAVPATVFLGALELIRHLWQLTQQAARPAFGATGSYDADGATVPTGFALPARVLELWKPFKRPPGVA